MANPAEVPLALTETIRSSASGSPLASSLRLLMTALRRVTGARRALVVVRAANDELITAAIEGIPPAISAAEEINACRPAIDMALQSGRIVITDDATRDGRFHETVTRSGSEIRLLGAVPLFFGGRPHGALCFHNDEPSELPPGLSTPLADLAHAAALLVELNSLRERQAEDDIVGGPAPRLFQQRLEAEVARALEFGRLLAVIGVRIDRFPELAAPLVPEFRRDLLREAAKRIKTQLPGSAVMARLPGDPNEPDRDPARFLILLPEIDHGRAATIANDIRKAMADLPLPLKSSPIAATSSVALACFPDDAVDAETLFTTVDAGLHEASRVGNRVHDFRGKPKTGAYNVSAPISATREGRALGAMLKRMFGSELELKMQLDLAAAWILAATDAEAGLVAVLDDAKNWFLHTTSNLPSDRHAEAIELSKKALRSGKMEAGRSGAIAIPIKQAVIYIERNGQIPAHLAPMLASLGSQVQEGLQASVRLQKHRDDLRMHGEAVSRTLEELRSKFDFSTIVGESAKILAALQIVVRAAPTPGAILITGESGTGKELIARAAHANSARKTGPFVVMNCAAVPPSLLESELFGHVKGAFTGAVSDRKGLFESADGGTLFLDEVAETGPEIQAKLLRALQFGDIQRVGSDAVHRVNVRVVAATNKDLTEEVKARRFREDLYYRINVFRVALPSLRERPEDIPRLVDYFCRRFATEMQKEGLTIAPDVYPMLQRYAWPGNVRELENIVLRAVAYSTGGTITVRDLPEEVLALKGTAAPGAVPHTAEELERMKRDGTKELTDRLEQAFIDHALKTAGGNISEAARLTGINRTSLQKLLSRHGIDTDKYKS